jgi:hypothetical protein
MSKKLPSHLSDEPVLDVTTATMDELLDAWAANRNNITATMTSEEVTRRLFKQREETRK